MARDGAVETSAAIRLEQNRILALLPPAELEELRPHVRLFEPARGTHLYAPGDEVETVLLSCGALISLVVVMPDGRTAEAGLVGPEGLIGSLSSAMPHIAFTRAVVQIPGPVAEIRLDAIERHKERSPTLRDLIARYADCFIAQLLQTIACNALHPLEKRLARWLVTVGDLTQEDELPLTQEYLSEMLGVQRTTVTLAAAALQARGLIAYSRGRIRISDAHGLQGASCGCNLAIRRHEERLFGRTGGIS